MMEFLNRLSLNDVYERRHSSNSDPKYSWWLPHKLERDLLVNLAHALTTTRPFLLDAACGSGLLGRIFAEDGNIRVISVDIQPDDFQKIPPPNSDHLIIRGDIWDIANSLGVRLEANLKRERDLILKTIRNEPKGPSGRFYTVYNGMNIGYEEDFADEIKRLQEINRKDILTPSPVDLVLCSFMPQNTGDLSVPLRDGIHPKALVYIRTIDGLAGAGDYYLEEPEDPELLVSIVSFNPGKNYRTAARWRSPSYLDWKMSQDNVLIKHAKLTSEVIVQLRNDVVLPGLENYRESPDHPWDSGIIELVKKLNRHDEFQDGVKAARQMLFKES